MTEEKMTLKEALDHLSINDIKVPLVNVDCNWMLDEYQLGIRMVASQDIKAFRMVINALNNGELDPWSFIEENKSRNVILYAKPKSMMLLADIHLLLERDAKKKKN